MDATRDAVNVRVPDTSESESPVPSQPTPFFDTAIPFAHLNLRQAEEELVGACIDHESALRIALASLPLEPFRSHVTHDLRRIFYTLAGWLERGAYNPATNRDRLKQVVGDDYLESLFCGFGIVPEYVSALCDAINESNRLQDDALAAVHAWHWANPLDLEVESRPAPPLPVATAPQRKPEPERGGVRGLDL
ncbi:MAG: hypothetical protein U0990_12730 [Candidatus Nanopelagicales bacterium]|nr:hypothetical protein [Candidatus Nanopelagicales bacterium]